MKNRLWVSIFILCIALVLPSCSSYTVPTFPTPTPSSTPPPSPIPLCWGLFLQPENVQTKLEISPDLKITMSRSGGLLDSRQPSYRVTIYGDGKVHYQGWSSVPTTGIVEKQIQEAQLQRIVTAFEEANFYAIYGKRDMVITDNSELDIGIEKGGETHDLSDEGICTPDRSQCPVFCGLGDKIDEILGTPW